MKAREKLYFDSFREVVKAVHSTLDIQKVLNMLVRKVTQVMEVKGGAIRLLDPNRRTLELVSSYGLSKKYIEKGTVDADRSMADAMKGKTICIVNVRRDPRIQYQREAVDEGIYGIVSVPLTIKRRVIGVLRLYTRKPRTFSRAEIHFVEALAEIGAIAIENARMYERVKKDYEDVMSDIYTFTGFRRSI
ncbi:MAG: GAF domain-containing protein [Syntrophaceae bacterium]|nr:GAF domain-containing protein [Syntrophaceae bacterium]